MMDLLGKQITVVRANDRSQVGARGVLALESMNMLTITTGATKLSIPKSGTVFRVNESGSLVIGTETIGRLEDRLARGSKI